MREQLKYLLIASLLVEALFAIGYLEAQTIERPIVYCGDTHRGVKTTIPGFANLSYRYLCKDGTIENDRAETETF